MLFKIHLRSLLCLLFTTPVFAQQAIPDSIKVLKPGATLRKVAGQFAFTEGPAVAKNGDVFFTDQPNDKIWQYHASGVNADSITLFMQNTGRSNGMFFDKTGNLITCADEKDEIWSISPAKKVTVLLRRLNGLRFNGPNDLWVDKTGNIYFTDPYYQRDYWDRKKPDLKRQDVYFLAKGKGQAQVIDSTLKQPNGIVGTPDGKYLYVADIQDNKTYRYEIGKPGELLHRVLFVNQGSDGMTLDQDGNLYLTGKGVTIYNAAGNKMGNIPVPAGWVGNICFGGKARTTLFITASESIFTLEMAVKGVE